MYNRLSTQPNHTGNGGETMNVFNRIVIILLILAAMILIPMALILPE